MTTSSGTVVQATSLTRRLTQPPVQWTPEGRFLQVKQSAREVDQGLCI